MSLTTLTLQFYFTLLCLLVIQLPVAVAGKILTQTLTYVCPTCSLICVLSCGEYSNWWKKFCKRSCVSPGCAKPCGFCIIVVADWLFTKRSIWSFERNQLFDSVSVLSSNIIHGRLESFSFRFVTFLRIWRHQLCNSGKLTKQSYTSWEVANCHM